MTNQKISTEIESILAQLRRTPFGVALVTHVWATPDGEWPETKQARRLAIDALPKGVNLADAMDAIRAAGLADHIHPSRK